MTTVASKPRVRSFGMLEHPLHPYI